MQKQDIWGSAYRSTRTKKDKQEIWGSAYRSTRTKKEEEVGVRGIEPLIFIIVELKQTLWGSLGAVMGQFTSSRQVICFRELTAPVGQSWGSFMGQDLVGAVDLVPGN